MSYIYIYRTAGISDKLGTLYTWAIPKKRRHRRGDPVYDVLAAENVDTTAPMMPNWDPDRDSWSVSRGVFDNRYTLPPRRRPPFKDCDCQKEPALESEFESDSESDLGEAGSGSDKQAEEDSDSEDAGFEAEEDSDSEDSGSKSASQKDSDSGDSDSDT